MISFNNELMYNVSGSYEMNTLNTKKRLIKEITKFLEIIKIEYPYLNDIPENYNLDELVHIEETGTISLFVQDSHFYFPLSAYKILDKIKTIPGFGIDKNHKTCTPDTMIINDNTYIDYIKHVFVKGLTAEEYFKEILLHETLHFSGSRGGSAIREGINELKTRQLALKYGLETSACGYPKETRIAYELEKIFSKEVVDRIAFSKNNAEIKKILDPISPDATKFYFELENMMDQEFYLKYMQYKFPGLTGPLKKTKKYNTIDYTDAYNLINQYKEMHLSGKQK